MAPKGGKKGGKKKGGKKKDKKEEEEEGKEKEAISELDKHYYLNQIQALDVKLRRSSTRCDQLDEAERHARTQYQLLQRDKTDVITFLKDRLSAKSDEVEELRSRLAGLIKAKKAEQEEYEARLTLLAKEAENTRLDLNDKIIALTRKLESLEEFRQHKEELEGKMAALEKELTFNKEQHQEKESFLERASLVEAAAQRAELEARVTRITEDLRKAAQTEVHSTTRRALQENEALTKQMDLFRTRITALRSENNTLREALSDSQVREGLLQDTVRQVTSRGERRARLLQAVTEKAEEQARVWRDYHRLARDNHQLRRDLQVVQAEVDAATQQTCELRHKVTEKDVALDLTACHLRQQDDARDALKDTVTAALALLHQAAFTGGEEDVMDSTGPILQQLVTLLSSVEHSHGQPKNVSRPSTPKGRWEEATTQEEEGRRREGSGRQVTYHEGDLGLLPRPVQRKAKQMSSTTN
ncbi:hypothetical protein Pmani_027065 [Petrolisthes manimaculis]|uniref:Cilia- and flagella-associated protein 157 n=1 Tax=Petrolisthes manimaculis TaxID=1843537 RepID=A0AAE1TX88_9EUCA|nr:hypothetical protein Pmani_027065 [Petrolisthes manimaculis]